MTPEKQKLYREVDRRLKAGNKVGVVRLIGGSTEDHGDHINGYDDGEPLRDYR